jgi:hypothetical protein
MRIQTVLKSSIVVGTTALDLANNLGGVPFAGAAATLLGELGRSCEQVKIHKVREPITPISLTLNCCSQSDCRLLLRHAQTLLDALQDGSSGLEGTTLQQAADELEMFVSTLNCVEKRHLHRRL